MPVAAVAAAPAVAAAVCAFCAAVVRPKVARRVFRLSPRPPTKVCSPWKVKSSEVKPLMNLLRPSLSPAKFCTSDCTANRPPCSENIT